MVADSYPDTWMYSLCVTKQFLFHCFIVEIEALSILTLQVLGQSEMFS